MGRITAKVAVARAVYAIDKPYDYLVPAELEGVLAPGTRVLVPFAAGNRASEGIVLSLAEEPSAGRNLKLIQAALDSRPVLDHRGLQLALWMRERYFCTVYDCVKAMLPAGLTFSLRDRVSLVPGTDREAAYGPPATPPGRRSCWTCCGAGAGRGTWSRSVWPSGRRTPNPAIRRLTEAGVAAVETSAQRGVGGQDGRSSPSWPSPPKDAMALVTPRRRKRPPCATRSPSCCAPWGRAGAKELCYFTGASMSTLKSLEEKRHPHPGRPRKCSAALPWRRRSPPPTPSSTRSSAPRSRGLDRMAASGQGVRRPAVRGDGGAARPRSTWA